MKTTITNGFNSGFILLNADRSVAYKSPSHTRHDDLSITAHLMAGVTALYWSDVDEPELPDGVEFVSRAEFSALTGIAFTVA